MRRQGMAPTALFRSLHLRKRLAVQKYIGCLSFSLGTMLDSPFPASFEFRCGPVTKFYPEGCEQKLCADWPVKSSRIKYFTLFLLTPSGCLCPKLPWKPMSYSADAPSSARSLNASTEQGSHPCPASWTRTLFVRWLHGGNIHFHCDRLLGFWSSFVTVASIMLSNSTQLLWFLFSDFNFIEIHRFFLFFIFF